MEKNSNYKVNGNEQLDRLFFMMENQSVLSDSLAKKIHSILFHIQSGNIGEEGFNFIENKIKELITEMKWINIFSKEFIANLEYSMIRALYFEKNRK